VGDFEVATGGGFWVAIRAQAMSAYLQWLAMGFDQLKEDLPGLHREYRTMARQDLHQVHDRTPEIVASLMVGLSTFATFIMETGVFTSEEAETFSGQGWSAIIEAAKNQAQHQGSEDVVNMFLRLLTAAISSGRAHLADAKNNEAPGDCTNWGWHQIPGMAGGYRESGNRIGWVDDQGVYLNPDAAFAEVQKLAQSQGSGFPIKQNTLWKRLAERGLLASAETGRNTDRVTIAGYRKRAIHLAKACLGIEGQVSATDEVIHPAGNRDPDFWTEHLARGFENSDKVVH
jgi:hypothetical protein